MRMVAFSSSLLLLLGMLALTDTSELTEDKISLVKKPDKHYYIVRNKPAEIVCQARNAEEIVFTCMGTQIPETSVETDDVSDVDPGLIQAKIEVTRADVQNHEGGGDLFWCSCSAVDVDGHAVVTSHRAYVSFAYLRSKFTDHLTNTTATVGENVELTCGAPDGQPKPEIIWKQDDKRVDTDNSSRLIVTDQGNLVIKSATVEDSGSYQCVARNVAGRRGSLIAYLVVTVLEESAEPGVMLSEGGGANNSTAEVVKPRSSRQSVKTYFIVEPQARSYITPDKPLLLDCAVVAADILTFSCNNKRMHRDQQTVNQGLDAAGNRNIQSQLKINYADVEAHQSEFGEDQAYQCICNAWFHDSANPSGWGRLDTNSSLGHVVIARLDSVFHRDPSDVTTAVGTDATLTCDPPTGQPVPIVYWYKDGSRLEARSRLISDSKGHLVIRNVQSDDAGLYSCLAQNSVKSVQSRGARLIVIADGPVTTTAASFSEDNIPDFPEVIPETPVFLHDFQSEYTVEKGGALTLVCAVMSADQITLECGGRRLSTEEYDLQSKVHRETGKRLLYTKTVVSAQQVAEKPDGFYCQCTAWHVNDQRAWDKVASTRAEIRLTTSSVYIGDHFAVNPKDTEAFLKSDVELDCKPPEGNPPPSVHWLKDGVQIDTYVDPNFVIMNDGKLILEFLRGADEGIYICVANNEAGTRFSQAARLSVSDNRDPTDPEVDITTQSPETATLPEILTQPIFSLVPSSENYIINDQPVNLTCTVVGASSLRFHCNGEPVAESTRTSNSYRHPETGSSIHESFLVVTKEMAEAVSLRGPAPFTCTCRAYYTTQGFYPANVKYIESSKAVVEVAYLHGRFLQQPLVTRSPGQERVDISCKPPSGVPKPEIHWVKDGFRLSPNGRIRVADGNLVIDKFSREDVGAYTCVAENLVGQRTSSTVHVADEPHERATTPEPAPKPTAEPEPDTATVATVTPPHFNVDLDPVYELVDNRPVTIICGAVAVESVTMTCGLQDVKDLVIRESVQPDRASPRGEVTFVKVIQALKRVSRSDLDNYESDQDYYCQCHGRFLVSGERDYRTVDSSRGVVRIKKPNCPEVEACQRIHSPVNDLSLKAFCGDKNNLVHCAGKALTDCNVTYSPPAEEIDNLIKVIDWFSSFCYRIFETSQSMQSCYQEGDCDRHISRLATDNTTNWCRVIDPLLECTKEVVNRCYLDELRHSLQDLYTQSVAITCSVDVEKNIDGDDSASTSSSPATTGEPLGETRPGDGGEAAPKAEITSESTERGDDDDDRNGDIVEEGAAAAKASKDNGSSLLHTANLLAAILPLVMMVVMALR